jgi:phospholipid/cholesterol/gamma-HCH transport system substrate-binding protein
VRRLLSVLAVAAALVGAVVLTGAREADSTLKTYEIEFDNGFGLVEGGDLKVGGVKAGQTTGFELTEREPYRVIVTGEVTEPGFEGLRRDAECAVRQQSLIGEYFVDCDLGSKEAPELPDGGRIPVDQTSSTIPPDLINTVMRRPYRERFRLIISELGAGLAGRPEDLNEVIRRAHPALKETTETLAVLRSHNKMIRDFFADADRVSAAVEPVKEDVARWAEEAADTTAIQASRSDHLGRYWNRLPEFLAELDPTMAELSRTASRQVPTLRKLGAAAPELERFLRSAVPFARESRESIDDLGGAADTGRTALREAREEVAELAELSVEAPRLAKPLRQFLQTIDDRGRSTDNDPLAAQLAPPAPDKTAYKQGQGFTGMESFWNYIHWQTLGINAFDEFGHLLRIVAFTGGPCSPYAANPTKAQVDQCASWLGPTQPGVLGQPDPTETQEAAALERAAHREKAAAAPIGGGHRGAGEPRATEPLPGRPDVSRPQIVLPEDVQELLDRLRRRRPGPELPAPAPGEVAPEQVPTELLDYLLGP